MNQTHRTATSVLLALCVGLVAGASSDSLQPPAKEDPPLLVVENASFRIGVDPTSGAIASLVVKNTGADMIGEQRLASNFRICLPLEDYLCNYIDGREQKPVRVEKTPDSITAKFSGMQSSQGIYPIDLTYTIVLDGPEIRLRAKLTNHFERPISEFYFPQIGGWTQFGRHRDAALAMPAYQSCSHSIRPFTHFPGGRGLGAEAAEWAVDYPGGAMVMPWLDLYDAESNQGLYLGYHDEAMRFSTWHMYLYPSASGGPQSWLTPEQTAGEPIGIVFSHVRYPFIHSGETLDSGEFIIRLHDGDWHKGSLYYRDWFMAHFPFDKANSWLRKQSAWFTSIIYQPEDKIVADFDTYAQWTKDAQAYGVNTFEIIGWDRGGLERQYPEYEPEERLGGRDGWVKLLKSIRDNGGRSLPFVNYNILDPNTEWYRRELHKYTHQDEFGDSPNWMAWGESTLIARRGFSVRRHRLASIVPPLERILEDMYVQIAKDGADGLQIDKIVVSSGLDFNPLLTRKPDVANCQGLIDGIARVLARCRKINPDFCLAAESMHDRLLPYVDVFYRNSGGFTIAPLRYVFPEWTACMHVAAPRDFNSVNSAVVTGSVLCVEPHSYQDSLANPLFRDLGEYIREVERIRSELKDIVFLGRYYDDTEAAITEISAPPSGAVSDLPGVRREVIIPVGASGFTPAPSGQLVFKVHGHRHTDRRAIVVANISAVERGYTWEFHHADVAKAELYEPFEPVRTITAGEGLRITPRGLQIIVEKGERVARTLKLRAKCGTSAREIVFAERGYNLSTRNSFKSAVWPGPVNHCRATDDTMQFELKTPPNVAGRLRLFIIDPDRHAGGRKQEITLEGASLGVVEDFAEGRWLEHEVGATATANGRVSFEIANRKPGANAVLSIVEWHED